ncbi:ATP-binding protein [Fontisphaera persica]|uniref:sensor histidine kinase n=1 Tax=Fontisphaera persica TaxID=2974023 RepID=UPI0024C06804|nr:ATP-binding protein [Fontisphaera persica]WCJ59944.1 ATP-binding protein [Fontisphaera persica]
MTFLDEQWALWLFAAGVALVVLHTWWMERRHRRARELAEREYTRQALQKQQQLQAQFQAQQEALFNSMIEGVLVLDQQGRIQLFNQSLKDLLQFARDLRGLTLIEAFRLPELERMAHRLLKECTVAAVEIELPGATPRYLQVNGSAVLDRQGRQQGAIMVFHDLTRLKQLEKTRQEFVANVSHELRTPLAMIKGFVETLLSGAKDDPAVATRFLQNIEKHTDRLTFLIEDLLTISRLESGKVLFNLRPTNLRETVQHVMEDLQTRAADKQIRFFNQVPEELEAWADGDRLQQVLFNLLDNAIKYGHVGGKVEITGQRLDQGMVRLSVADDGPGVPPESRERIFERFYRVDKARSREAGGTGLGLAIVKHIIQCHGGRAWVESEMGRGSTFHVTLPADEAAAKASENRRLSA